MTRWCGVRRQDRLRIDERGMARRLFRRLDGGAGGWWNRVVFSGSFFLALSGGGTLSQPSAFPVIMSIKRIVPDITSDRMEVNLTTGTAQMAGRVKTILVPADE